MERTVGQKDGALSLSLQILNLKTRLGSNADLLKETIHVWNSSKTAYVHTIIIGILLIRPRHLSHPHKDVVNECTSYIEFE